VKLNLKAPNSTAAALTIRECVPAARNAEFLEWKYKHGAPPANVLFTNWSKAFGDFSKIQFATPIKDFMLGTTYLSRLCKGHAKTSQRLTYLLPQCEGNVKVVAVMPRETGRQFVVAEEIAEKRSAATYTELEH